MLSIPLKDATYPMSFKKCHIHYAPTNVTYSNEPQKYPTNYNMHKKLQPHNICHTNIPHTICHANIAQTIFHILNSQCMPHTIRHTNNPYNVICHTYKPHIECPHSTCHILYARQISHTNLPAYSVCHTRCMFCLSALHTDVTDLTVHANSCGE